MLAALAAERYHILVKMTIRSELIGGKWENKDTSGQSKNKYVQRVNVCVKCQAELNARFTCLFFNRVILSVCMHLRSEEEQASNECTILKGDHHTVVLQLCVLYFFIVCTTMKRYHLLSDNALMVSILDICRHLWSREKKNPSRDYSGIG